jgi:FKBP-type peptidyl-prolyl cis-trans isomerase FkpA
MNLNYNKSQKMKYSYYLILSAVAVVLLVSCTNLDFKRTKSGMLYKIAKSGNTKDPIARPGNIIKLHFTEKLNDSVLQTTFGKLPFFTGVDTSAAVAYSPSEVLSLVRKGDSVVVVQLMDTLFKKGLQPQFPSAKKGDRLVYNLKILDVFPNDSLARIDNAKEMGIEQQRQQKEMAGAKEKERQEIETYLATHKITAQKTPKGAYLQIITVGDGPQADSGKLVSLKYRGITFAGKTFDTNMDSSFHHSEPLRFVVGANTMIQGLEDAVRYLKKGGKGKVFVPAVLAYGPNPGPGGSTYENLIFDIEVVDVAEPPPTNQQ